MPELTIRNIEKISRDIRKQNISYSYLADELIDHVCCDVENKMEQGASFDDAYRSVLRNIGSGRIKEIQEETLYAIDTNYRIMKNIMKISGVAGTIILVAGAMIKILHYPGAGILMTLGALLLSSIFLPSSLTVLWKETHNSKSMITFISAFIAGVSFIFGTLFKVQHWPGAGYILLLAAASFVLLFIPSILIQKLSDPEKKGKNLIYITGAAGAICYALGMLFKIQHWPLAAILLVTGILLLCVIALPWYTWMTWRNDSQIDVRFIFMVTAIMLIMVPGALISLNMQHTFNNGFYSALEKQQVVTGYLYNENSASIKQFGDSARFSGLRQLHEKTNALLKQIGQIQSELALSDKSQSYTLQGTVKGETVITEQNLTPDAINNPFLTEPVRAMFLPGSQVRTELEKSVSDYLSSISELIPEESSEQYKALLDLSVYLPFDATGNRDVSVMSALHALELLRNGILGSESNVISAFIARNK
jgi:hypothetical protein